MATEQISATDEAAVRRRAEGRAAARPSASGGSTPTAPSVTSLLDATTARLRSMHKSQVHRAPWPEPSSFDASAYPAALRRSAAVQWAGRARNEHGSVHQFSQLLHTFTRARVPVHIMGALSRLITDEVRHAELCAAAALALHPEGEGTEAFRFPLPGAPWQPPPAPEPDGSAEAIYRWAADVIITACCIGETLSRPMLTAVETVATDPYIEGVAAQILRDEHLHATFGWEALAWLVPRLDEDSKAWVKAQLPRRFAGFERSTARGVRVEHIAEQGITIEPGDPASPNLGTLSKPQYAVIYFATFEAEILPKLQELGFDAGWAWGARLPLLDG